MAGGNDWEILVIVVLGFTTFLKSRAEIVRLAPDVNQHGHIDGTFDTTTVLLGPPLEHPDTLFAYSFSTSTGQQQGLLSDTTILQHLQVWRPQAHPDQELSYPTRYRLISQSNRLDSALNDDTNVLTIVESLECVYLQQGDRIGAMYRSPQSSTSSPSSSSSASLTSTSPSSSTTLYSTSKSTEHLQFTTTTDNPIEIDETYEFTDAIISSPILVRAVYQSDNPGLAQHKDCRSLTAVEVTGNSRRSLSDKQDLQDAVSTKSDMDEDLVTFDRTTADRPLTTWSAPQTSAKFREVKDGRKKRRRNTSTVMVAVWLGLVACATVGIIFSVVGYRRRQRSRSELQNADVMESGNIVRSEPDACPSTTSLLSPNHVEYSHVPSVSTIPDPSLIERPRAATAIGLMGTEA